MKKIVISVFLSVFAIGMVVSSCSKKMSDVPVTDEVMLVRQYVITVDLDEKVAQDSIVFVVNNTDRIFFENEDGTYTREMPRNVPAINKVAVKAFDIESGKMGFISEEFYSFKIDTAMIETKRGDHPGIIVDSCGNYPGIIIKP